jgi:hypothetical protein
MDKIKLPSMVEYVFEIGVPGTTDKQFTDSVMLFANFLSQQPNTGMFLPAVEENGEWRVLSKPIFDFNNEYDGEKRREFAIALKEFETALDNVMFEGCVAKKVEDYYLISNDSGYVWASWNESKTIEDLIPYSLTLTPKFAKELGLI